VRSERPRGAARRFAWHSACVGSAAAARESDRGRVRELLATAEGYAVLERRGRRVATFVELVGARGEEIAIHQDGLFLWRRRVLPITMVATILPEQRAVVLNADRRTLDRTSAGPTSASRAGSADERARSDQESDGRIARCVSVGESDVDQGKDGQRREQALQTDDAEPSRTRPPGQPTSEPRASDEGTAESHLLFVSTPRGYLLVQREGRAPAAHENVEVPDQTGLFQIAKLAPSPLPDDPRVCAYLERIELRVASSCGATNPE
jgi:hypothetical protein